MKDNKSPYCEICGACGEDGCCSHLQCFSALIKNPKCEYGRTYLKDATFNSELCREYIGIFSKYEKDENYSRESFIADFNTLFDKIYDKVYK